MLSAKSVTGYRGVTREGSRFIARRFVQVGTVHARGTCTWHMRMRMRKHMHVLYGGTGRVLLDSHRRCRWGG